MDEDGRIYREKLYLGFMDVIMREGGAQGEVVTDRGELGAMVRYDTRLVIEAAVAAAASIAFQSESIKTQRDRRALADYVRAAFLAQMKGFEQRFSEGLLVSPLDRPVQPS